MASKKLGKQTLRLDNPPSIIGSGSVVGPKEGQGPLGGYFHRVCKDTLLGEISWEKAERKMLEEAMNLALEQAQIQPSEVDFILAGDLLNQIISANYTARAFDIPFIGLYGACSTMIEGMALGALLVDGGYADKVLHGASSHYDTAERQYRFPTELGTQRPMSAQWTVTGAGATLLANQGMGPYITHVTFGKVIDRGIQNANDMGSAMAPAVADTIITHFKDTGRGPGDYDLIISGDLAVYGHAITLQLVREAGYDLNKNYTDCGILIFDPAQDVHAGGSGCGCSATVVASWLLKHIWELKYRRVLVIGSGALLSTVAIQQGESIPGIGHAVVLEKFE